MSPRLILDNRKLSLTLDRLSHQVIENHGNFEQTAIIGIQPRGIFVSNRIVERIERIRAGATVPYGKLDITFYRDDFRRSDKQLAPAATAIDFSVENKRIILVDDVLYTGRTVRAALDALLDFGRPEKVELLVLIDRRFSRHFPIRPDYVGRTVDAIRSEKVKVEWREQAGEDGVWITG